MSRYAFICILQCVWSCWAQACSCMMIRTETLSWLVSRCKIMMTSHGYRRKAPHTTSSWKFCSLDFKILCLYVWRMGWAFVLENWKWPHVVCWSYMQLCVHSHWLLNTVPPRNMLTMASLNCVYFHSSLFSASQLDMHDLQFHHRTPTNNKGLIDFGFLHAVCPDLLNPHLGAWTHKTYLLQKCVLFYLSIWYNTNTNMKWADHMWVIHTLDAKGMWDLLGKKINEGKIPIDIVYKSWQGENQISFILLFYVFFFLAKVCGVTPLPVRGWDVASVIFHQVFRS